MMATSPFFSATITTSQPCRTYIGPLSEFILYSTATSKSLFLSLPLPTSTTRYLPQHNQSPTVMNVYICNHCGPPSFLSYLRWMDNSPFFSKPFTLVLTLYPHYTQPSFLTHSFSWTLPPFCDSYYDLYSWTLDREHYLLVTYIKSLYIVVVL